MPWDAVEGRAVRGSCWRGTRIWPPSPPRRRPCRFVEFGVAPQQPFGEGFQGMDYGRNFVVEVAAVGAPVSSTALFSALMRKSRRISSTGAGRVRRRAG